MTTETKPKCKLISHAAFRFSFPIRRSNKKEKRERGEQALKKMEKNEQSLKTNFHKTIFRSPPWQTKTRWPRPGELLHSTSGDRPLDYWKVHDGTGGFLGQFESQSECECESKCEFGLEFPFLRRAACAPCQKITRTAAFCNNNRRCLA